MQAASEHNYDLVLKADGWMLPACHCCMERTLILLRWSAAMPFAAAQAAAIVVMVGMRLVTAARRMAFSSNHGSALCGVFITSCTRSFLIRFTTLGRPSFTL